MQSDTIHSNLDSMLIERINVVKAEIHEDIEQSQKKLEEGILATGGDVCEYYIRSIRSCALSRFGNIKAWLNSIFLSYINSYAEIEAIQLLQEKNTESAEIFKIKETTELNLMRAEGTYSQLGNYEKYLLYSEGIKKSRSHIQQDEKSLDSSILKALAALHGGFIAKSTLFIILGLLIAAVCAIADYSILLPVFFAKNMDPESAARSTTICVAALDLPPYVLGLLISKKNDGLRALHLHSAGGDLDEKNNLRGMQFTISIVLFSIVLLLTFYIAARVALFLGGGDFNAALHFILEHEYSFKDVQFNVMDFITSIVPLVTSAVSYAVGKILTTSHTDYIKASILVIDKEVLDYTDRCKEIIADCEKRSTILADELSELKQSIWTSYKGLNSTPPDSDAEFAAQITNSYRLFNLPFYNEAYQACAAKIRDEAVRALCTINTELTSYSSDQVRIASMEYTRAEALMLDEIWVVDSNTPQSNSTQTMIDEINAQIVQFRNVLCK